MGSGVRLGFVWALYGLSIYHPLQAPDLECDVSEDDELEEDEINSDETLAERLTKAKPVPPPSSLIKWLREVKGLRPATVKLYNFCLGKFFCFSRLLAPCKTPTLDLVWDQKLCAHFFKTLSYTRDPTSLPNFHNALQAARKYLYLNDQDPQNSLKLQEGFTMMSKVAQKGKIRHLLRKKQKLQDESNLLREFYQKVYHGSVWKKFFSVALRIKRAVLEGRAVRRVKRRELYLCNCVMIGSITSCNFKRPADLTAIDFKTSYKEVCQSVKKFKTRHPEEDMRNGQKRLDRQKCEPAVMLVEESSKKSRVDHVVLLHPRDILAAKLYGKYIRPYGPKPPKVNSFLINSRGKKLGQNISRYLKDLGDVSEVQGLCFNRLRQLAETENQLDSTDDDVPMPSRISDASRVTSHLGHSQSVAERYYTIKDKRSSVRAANRLLYLLESAGEKDQRSQVLSGT